MFAFKELVLRDHSPKCLLKPGKHFSLLFFDGWLLSSLPAGRVMPSGLPMGMFPLSLAVSARSVAAPAVLASTLH